MRSMLYRMKSHLESNKIKCIIKKIYALLNDIPQNKMLLYRASMNLMFDLKAI